MSAEAHKGETKEQKERLQEKETAKATTSANKKKKGKQSLTKQKGMSVFFRALRKLWRGAL